MTSRKDFIRKACISTACLCGCFAIKQQPAIANTETPFTEKNFFQDWIKEVVLSINQFDDEEQKRQALKSCANSHYKQLNMDEMLKPYIGKIDSFISFISNEWGWKIKFDPIQKMIIADENKATCVCPIMPASSNNKIGAMCYCSEGFAELMFSKVLNKEAKATIVSSIHHGDEKCIYQINF